MIKAVLPDYLDFCQTAPEYIYAWTVILCKLVRLLASPYHYDSWKDIAGYATLVVKHLEGSQKDLPG